ncbi:MAG TPA: 2-hydroxy-3-oxopropionate reductase [Actinomycetota bacterium]|nr:2-hydroxy-3-oxopropionate reductase [Actinomycetota bacterium]
MTERVGFVGLGLMGKPMARNLLGAGFPLTVHSRSAPPVDELVGAGAARASSPAEVAAASDVVVTMLPDTPDVEAVLFGDDGIASGASEGSLLIDMSTIDPIATRGYAERLAGLGVSMLDAPVSGGEVGATDGTLSIMVGGPEEVFDRALPLLRAMGGTIVHVGPSGAGQVTKACNQLVVASAVEAVAEALVLAAKAGVDPVKVREALLGGFAGSKVLELHGRRMLDGDFAPGFRSALMAKDGRIVVRAAAELGAPIPAFRAVADRLEAMLPAGRGDLDYAALVTLLEDEAGSSLAPEGETPA